MEIPTMGSPSQATHVRSHKACTCFMLALPSRPLLYIAETTTGPAHFCREQHDPVTCPPLCNTTFSGRPHPLRPLPCCQIARRTDDGILHARKHMYIHTQTLSHTLSLSLSLSLSLTDRHTHTLSPLHTQPHAHPHTHIHAHTHTLSLSRTHARTGVSLFACM